MEWNQWIFCSLHECPELKNASRQWGDVPLVLGRDYVLLHLTVDFVVRGQFHFSHFETNVSRWESPPTSSSRAARGAAAFFSDFWAFETVLKSEQSSSEDNLSIQSTSDFQSGWASPVASKYYFLPCTELPWFFMTSLNKN